MFKKIVGLGFSTKGKNAKEVEKYIQQLVDGGATEFFTGYNPPYWYEKFAFEVSPNGRFAEHEQITDQETLKSIVQEVHKHHLEIFVNLNAWYYTDVTFPYIKQMIQEFIDIGVDGIICGNISVLEYLKSIHYTGKINISTIFALYNSEAIRFFLENYKINKIILSREVTLREIEKLVTGFPNTKFEVFGEGDFCRYNNGLCFAEHKYGSRDICTVVVNDLIIKKKFKPDFKKIILDSSFSDLEKIGFFDDTFLDIFQQIGNILAKLDLGGEKESLHQKLVKIYQISKNRVDLFFDALKGFHNEKNQKIILYARGLNYVLKNIVLSEDSEYEAFNLLQIEIHTSIQNGLKYFSKKAKQIGGKTKLKAQETNVFYAKGDTLNLYSYLFFAKFPNIETVKFPTRGRNYNEKLKLIEQVIQQKKVPSELISYGNSPERTHYDLSYLFEDNRLWFRNMKKENIF